jgi:hypothetical protein
MPTGLDVVVPAHDERSLIGACLRAVLCDADGLDLRVVVVANGCTDGTPEVVRAVAARAARPGRQVVLVETAVAGKAAALNAADAHRRGCSVVYLDADTVLTPGTLRALAAALDATPAARLVMPRPLLVRPRRRLGRDFAAVWTRLPAVAGQVVGAGCYAVNPGGRARWAALPELWADDAFVRSRFAPAERHVIDDGAFLLTLPEGRELIRVVGRWHRGNAELPYPDSPAAGTLDNLAAVLARPALWPHLPGFLLVTLAARLARTDRWPRADRLRAGSGSGGAPVRVVPRVDAVIVGRADPVVLARCRAALRSAWADLTIAVPAAVASVRDAPGAAASADAAGAGADAGGDGDYVLLVGADVELADGAVDELLALAARFPRAGLYGGAPVGRPEVEPARPPVRGPAPRRREDVRENRRPAPEVLLIDRPLWQVLTGVAGDGPAYPHEPAYPHGAELVRRARRAGARPMSTPAARYRRGGEAGDRP